MHTTKDVLDALANRAGRSDRQAAAMIGVTQQTFSEWRTGKTFPSDHRACQFATMLGLDPAYIIAIIQHDRARSDEVRATWQRIAEKFSKAATLAAFAIGTGAALPPPANAAPNNQGPALCVMSNHRSRRARWSDAIDSAAALVRKLTLPAGVELTPA